MQTGLQAALLCLGAASLWAQTISPVVREGPYYVQTVTASLPIGSAVRIRVRSFGNLALHGGAPGTLTYSLKKRVRASSLFRAEVALRDLEVRSRRNGAWILLDLPVNRAGSYSAELSVNAPRTLLQASLETRGGGIVLTNFDGEAKAETDGGRIELDQLHSNITAITGGGDIHAGRVDGVLHCYSGGGAIRVNTAGRETWLDTAGGDILVRDALAPIHVATAGGNIHVDRSSAEVFARTGGGVIEVGQAAGLVTAETSGGAIQVNGARGVRCESTAGTIRLRNMQGAVRAATAQGNILAQLQSGQRIEDSILSTMLGDIIVLLSSNIPVTIQARNESAGSKRRIVSDFREIRIRNANLESGDPVVAEGVLNGGGPVLRIVTSSGIIFLRRQE
ncbi:MAG: hypothetical protein ACR2NN_05540 [Bryobacteraceae bacterium]